MDQWTNGPMNQWTNGPMEQWSNGPMDKRTNGTLEYWNIGTLEHSTFNQHFLTSITLILFRRLRVTLVASITSRD